MKIAQIAPPWISIPPQYYGGTENVIYHLVEELVALGHDVTLFAPQDARTSAKQISFIPRALLDEGVPLQTNLKAYYHLHKSLEYIFAHNFDIIHSHLSSSADLYLFPLTATLAQPHVTTLHGHFPFDRALNNWTGDADSYFMDWAQSVPLVASSESARAKAGYPTHFVGTIHNGVQMRDYTPADGGTEDYFVWLGRFTLEKGAHLAIEACRRAQVPLILAGIKDLQSRDNMQYYHHLVEPYIDGEQIRSIGPVDVSQKVNLLSRARALLNPVEWEEPFGMTLIEAMAGGCPVISFAHGAAPEIVVDGSTGFLVNDIHEMVHAMSHINEIDREQVRAHTEHHFSARAMAENYLRIYSKIITTNAFANILPGRVNTAPLTESQGAPEVYFPGC
ncbi:MAG: glycosyltransferase family 4 protein [Ktedonobacteraceae bacterium]